MAHVNASVLESLNLDLAKHCNVTLLLKRDDQLDAQIIGNKWRKLQPHIEHITAGNYARVITLGGAYSNHILSTSYLTQRYGIPTTGYVRGDELNEDSNDVLRQSSRNGMQLHFVSRRNYRQLRQSDFSEHISAQKHDYLLAEGGLSRLSMQGCKRIVNELDSPVDWLFCACGTGTTISGMAMAALKHQPSAKLVGVCALSPLSMIRNNIIDLCGFFPDNLVLVDDYAAGFGKSTPAIARLMHRYHDDFGIDLDFNYTGKMMACVEHYLKNQIIQASERVVAVHSGGHETAGIAHLKR